MKTVATEKTNELEVGMVVRDRKWGGKFTGTIVNIEDQSVFVAWHGTCVEDELDFNDVEQWHEAPAELSAWRGGIGCLSTDGSFVVEPT